MPRVPGVVLGGRGGSYERGIPLPSPPQRVPVRFRFDPPDLKEASALADEGSGLLKKAPPYGQA